MNKENSPYQIGWDSGGNTTVGELSKKLLSLEEGISGWAKAGMRAYTPDELSAYNASLVLLALFESKGIDVKGMRAYWVLHAPTEHPTIKESKPFDAKGDEMEVFDKVFGRVFSDRITKGEGDTDDENFIKEVDKRLGEAIYTKAINNLMDTKGRSIRAQLDENKRQIVAEEIRAAAEQEAIKSATEAALAELEYSFEARKEQIEMQYEESVATN